MGILPPDEPVISLAKIQGQRFVAYVVENSIVSLLQITPVAIDILRVAVTPHVLDFVVDKLWERLFFIRL